jgi:DNA repair photolyase
MYKPNATGTKEWSEVSVNCLRGCSHDCRYCYARERALRYRQIRTPEEWASPQVQSSAVWRRHKKHPGTVMFPTTHDILPEFLDTCLATLRGLLTAGNQVLIVSKPHLEVIRELLRSLAVWRQQVLFRFTIGARSDQILAAWEPGAPPYAERLAALQLSHGLGWETSVSAEPLLHAPDVRGLVNDLLPFVTETIWIGKMNQVRQRVHGVAPDEIARIEAGQTPAGVRRVYDQLLHEPKIRWKESYRTALGLS